MKAYEAILAIDEENAQAPSISCARCTRSGATGRSSSACSAARPSALPEGPRAPREFLEIAKLATERVKKPEVCIELWNEVIDYDPENAEALNALAGLHERAKDFDALAGVLAEAGRRHLRQRAASPILGKLGALYGDRLNDDEAAVEAWRTLLTLNPQRSQGARGAEEEVPHARPLGRPRGLLRRERQVGRVHPRPRDARGEGDRRQGAKIGLLMKIAELWMATEGQARSRGASATRRCSTIDAKHLAAAEALIPHLQAGEQLEGLRGARSRSSSATSRTTSTQARALPRGRRPLRDASSRSTQRKAFERYLVGLRDRARPTSSASTTSSAPRRRPARWEDVIAAYQAAIAAADDDGERDLAIALRLRLGRVLRRRGRSASTTRSRSSARSTRPTARTRDALGALERLYRDTQRASASCSRSTRRSAISRPIPRTSSDDPLRHRPPLRRARSRIRKRAIATLPRSARGRADAIAAALEALDMLYREHRRSGSRTSTCCASASSSIVDESRAHRSQVPPRPHAREASRRCRRRARELSRDPAARPGQRRRARSARGAARATRSCAPKPRASSKRSTRCAATGRSSSARSRSSRPADGDVAERVALLRKVARIAVENLGRRARAPSTRRPARSKTIPRSPRSRGELEQARRRSRTRGTSSTRIFNEIAEGLADAALAREYWMRLAAIDERLGKVDEAAKGYEHVLVDRSRPTPRRSPRWTRSTGAPSGGAISSACSGAASSSPTRRPIARALYAQMAEVYEEKLGKPEDAIAAYREVLGARRDEPGRAHRARRPLHAPDDVGRARREPRVAAPPRGDRRSGSSSSCCASRRCASREMEQVEPAIEGYRQVLERDPANAEALAALERLGRWPTHELAIAEILEPLYRAAGDYQKLIGVHEVQVRRRRRCRAQGRAAPPDRAAVRGRRRRPRLGVRHATRARSREDPARATPRRRGSIGSRARPVASPTSRGSSRRSPPQQTDPELGSRSITMSARVYEHDLGDIDSAIRHYRKVLDIDPTNLAGGRVARRALPRRRALRRSCRRSCSRRPRSSTTLEEKKAALFQAAQIEEDVLERHEQAIAVYGKILELDPEDLRAIDALIKLYLGLSRWEDLLAVYTKKADLVADADEKKLIYYQVGAVYERELGERRQRAIDTYQRVLELDPDDLQALGRLDVLYQTAQNWPELLSVLQHEAELATIPPRRSATSTGSPSSTRSTSTTSPRAIELYRDMLERDARSTPRRSQALEGHQVGRSAIRSAPRSVLEPVYDATGEWPKLISVLEVAGRASPTIRPRRSICCTASRASTKRCCATTAPRSTRTRARVAADNAQRGLARLPSSGWRCVGRSLARASPQLYDQELDKLAEEPERFVELGLRTRADLRDPARGRRQRRRSLPPRARGRRREPGGAYARSIAFLHETERWSDLAEILAREAEIGQTPDEILEFKYRLGQVYQIAAQRSRRGDRRLPRGSGRGARAREPRSRRSRGCSPPASSSRDRRDPRAALPSGRRMGEARRASTRRSSPTLKEPAERLAMYYRIAELAEESSSIALAARSSVYMRARQGIPARREDAAKRSSASRARSTAAGRCSPTPTPTCSACTTTRRADESIGKRLARVFEEELGDITEGRRDVPLRARRRAARHRCARQPRSHLHLARAVGRARADRSSSASTRPPSRTSWSSSTRASARSTKSSSSQLDDAVRAFRRIFDELEQDATKARSWRSSASTSRRQAWTDLNIVLRARARERRRRRRKRPRSARRSRTSQPTASAHPTRAIETWKRVLDLRGEDPEALSALANLYERSSQWAELCDVLERHSTSSTPTTSGSRCCSAARGSSPSSSAATTRRSTTTTACSTSTTPTSHALRAIADIWRKRARPATSSSRRFTRPSIARRGAARAGEPRGALPRARQDVRRRARPAIRSGRRLA